MLQDMEKLEIDENDLLYRRTIDDRKQLLLPKKLRPLVYVELYVKMGHPGSGRTVELIKERFYWPKMTEDMNHFVTKLCTCVKSKKPNITYEAPMKSITSSSPLQLVGIDYLHLDPCSGGYEYLLVITDHFTRFVQVYPTTNKSARTATKKLYNNFMMRYGIPEKLRSDRGREFENDLFQRLSKLCGIKKIRTTPYHRQTNGQVERMNQTIINMLKCLPEQYKSNSCNHVNKLVHAYNSTKSSATGYSPYYLSFGIHSRLSIDVLLPSQRSHTSSYLEYAMKWEDQMRQAYQIARNHSEARKKKDINKHNTKVNSIPNSQFLQTKGGERHI